MTATDTLLSRLNSPRPNGPNRWRAACPVCGERNRSTLSIGAGDSGAVLLKCFKSGCGPDQIAAALGLELCDLFPPKLENGHGVGPIGRRRLLSPTQALELLDHEMTLALLCASDLARGRQLDEPTCERLLQGAARVAMLRDEAAA